MTQQANTFKFRIRNSWVPCLLVLACSLPCAAQNEIADPAKLGFDVETLAEINETMQDAMDDGKLVGANALIMKDGQVCYYQQWGQGNREKDIPVTRDSIWRIYSMSKPITSIATMQLVEQGKLELDTPVSQYIPAFKNVKVLTKVGDDFEEVECDRPMTVRDLLRHSSGLTYGFFARSEADKRYRDAGILILNRDLKAMAESLAKLPLKHQPGSRFEYSVSTDLLGYLVEVASGQLFDEYLQENVFEPLGMTDTSFTVPKDKLDRFAEMYRPAGDGLQPSAAMASIRFVSQDNEFFSGGGGLCSTIDDYLQFSRMLLNKGELNGNRIVSEASLKEMWTNQLGDLPDQRGQFKFGLGFSISPEGDYGWGGAAGTRFWVNPEKNLAILFMVQINPNRFKYADQMRDIVYKALK